jgi:hypothetical protein
MATAQKATRKAATGGLGRELMSLNCAKTGRIEK